MMLALVCRCRRQAAETSAVFETCAFVRPQNAPVRVRNKPRMLQQVACVRVHRAVPGRCVQAAGNKIAHMGQGQCSVAGGGSVNAAVVAGEVVVAGRHGEKRVRCRRSVQAVQRVRASATANLTVRCGGGVIAAGSVGVWLSLLLTAERACNPTTPPG